MRSILVGLVLLACAVIVEAQPARVYRIGVIVPGELWYEIIDGLRLGLKQLGFEEGKQFVLEVRDTKADLKTAEVVAKNFEQEKVDLIYTAATSVTIPAKRATTEIPIAFCVGADPVVLGLVESFAKSGGRLTGVYIHSTDLTAKRLQILKEMIPKLRRVMTFYDPRNPIPNRSAKFAREALGQMKIQLVERHISTTEELQAGVRTLKAGEVDALFSVSDAIVNNQGQLIVDTARVKRLPTMWDLQRNVIKGGLASYSVSNYEAGRVSAKYVKRILAGEKTDAMPVEAIDKVELVINLKTAIQIGLTIPQWTLMKADRVIK